jgi:hypothetical protein
VYKHNAPIKLTTENQFCHKGKEAETHGNAHIFGNYVALAYVCEPFVRGKTHAWENKQRVKIEMVTQMSVLKHRIRTFHSARDTQKHVCNRQLTVKCVSRQLQRV